MWGWDREINPRITDWHHEACWVMTNGDPEGRVFYPILTQIVDSFSCSPLCTTFYIEKRWKRLPEYHEFAEMRHGDVILTLQWRHRSTWGQLAVDVRIFVFWIFPGLVWVCEVNRIHHWCSVGTGKSQPEGQKFQWETRPDFPVLM